MTDVLFVCVHNAGRSQMAAALLDHHAKGRVVVRSAGSVPAATLNPAVVAAMAEIGLDLSAAYPKPLTDEAVQASDVVITMGCGDTCAFYPGKRYLDWELPDPAGQGIEAVRPIRDDIERRVLRLLGELDAGVVVRAMRDDDADQVLAIYQAGLDGGEASFETAAPTWEAFSAARLPEHRFVAVDRGTVAGWVAVSAVSSRCVYAGVVEHSVYVSPAHQGRGIGTVLLNAVIDSTEAGGIWTIQAGIFPENTASLRLHEKAGFRPVGVRERVGRHHDRWRDVVFLERRSRVAGL
ncbi:hypothetical protein HerbRD11066_36810 [Herbidospora sp. RD11066]